MVALQDCFKAWLKNSRFSAIFSVLIWVVLMQGLLYIEGKLVKNVTMEQAESAIETELNKMKTQLITDKELQKVKNKTESLIAFEDISLMNRANSLATYELLGDAELMNKELLNYQAVNTEEILQECRNIFVDTNCSTVYYRSDK